MLFNKIRFSIFVLFSLQCSAAFAEYAATIYNPQGGYYLYESEANQQAFTFSQTESNQNYNFFLQPEIGPVISTIETSRINATINNSPVPYVSAQTFARGYTGNNSVATGSGASIGASKIGRAHV